MSQETILRELMETLGGASRAIQQIGRELAGFSRHAAEMILTGEPGTGKREIARAVQKLRSEHKGESVEFTRFDGASLAPLDVTVLPQQGILYLERLETLPIAWQRNLQEYAYTKKTAVQVIATLEWSDPYTLIETGTLDESLFHALNVYRIHLPPLRERPGDILGIATRFLEQMEQTGQATFAEITSEAAEFLTTYDWPGNRVELRAVLERAAILAEMDGGNTTLTPELLPAVVRGESPTESVSTRFRTRMSFADLVSETVTRALGELGDNSESLYEKILNPFEMELIRQVFERTRRVRTRTAQRLGINRNTLHRKMADYGIDESEN